MQKEDNTIIKSGWIRSKLNGKHYVQSLRLILMMRNKQLPKGWMVVCLEMKKQALHLRQHDCWYPKGRLEKIWLHGLNSRAQRKERQHMKGMVEEKIIIETIKVKIL